ncbi:DgyrCDS10200 [Dimorphilus gyrociliatus]|uniref:DgyrCDS10200 n=1 Tax=Dimorphilus gyrociliatus TaxID=2664684 RepID=A0A7I8W0N5_9ANNE|nr:DgyrCDS10200 [Dimorphilus gyrociliatus]
MEEDVDFFLNTPDDVLLELERDFERMSIQNSEKDEKCFTIGKSKGMEHLSSVVKLVERVYHLATKNDEIDKKCECLSVLLPKSNSYYPEEDHDQSSLWNKGLQKMRAKSTKVKASFNKRKDGKTNSTPKRSQSTGSINMNDIIQGMENDNCRKRREAKFSKRKISSWARKVRKGLANRELSISKSFKIDISKSSSQSDFKNYDNFISSPENFTIVSNGGKRNRLVRRRSSPLIYVEEDVSSFSRNGSVKSIKNPLKRMKDALIRTESFRDIPFKNQRDNDSKSTDNFLLLNPSPTEPVQRTRKKATIQNRPLRTSLVVFPSDEKGGIQNYLTADLAKRIGEWENRRDSTQQSTKHEDSLSRGFIKKMQEWEKKKRLDREKSPKTFISHPDTISYNGSISDEKSSTNLGEDFSRRKVEWEKIRDQNCLQSNIELYKNERSRSRDRRQKYEKLVSKDMQKIEKAQQKIQKETVKLQRLKQTMSVNEEAMCHGLSQDFAKKYHAWQRQHSQCQFDLERRSVSPLLSRRSEIETSEDQTDTISPSTSHDKTLPTLNLSNDSNEGIFNTKKSDDINFNTSTNEVNRLMKILGNLIERLNTQHCDLYKRNDWDHLDDLEKQLGNLDRLLERLDSAPKVTHAAMVELLKINTKINTINTKLTRRHILALKYAKLQTKLLNKCLALKNILRCQNGRACWKKAKSECNLEEFPIQENEMLFNSSFKLATNQSTQDHFLENCSNLVEESIYFTGQLCEKINGSLDAQQNSKQTQTTEICKKNVHSASLIEEIVPQFSTERRPSRPKLERIPAVEYQSPKVVKRSIISSDLRVYESTIPVAKNGIEKVDILQTSFSSVSVDSQAGEGMERLDIMEALVAERSKQLKNMIKKFDNTSEESENKANLKPKIPSRRASPRLGAVTYEKEKKQFFNCGDEEWFHKSIPSSTQKPESSFLTKSFKFSALKNVRWKLFKKNTSNEKIYVSALCRNAITVDVSEVSKIRETHILSENKTKNWLQSRFFHC